MTKALCLILLASGASALLAQGGPSQCGTADRKNINLIVGSDFRGNLGYPPFETQDDDEVIGFDASCACEIAHRLGFKGTQFLEVPLGNLLPVLAQTASPIDIAMSALSITSTAKAIPNVAFVKYNEDSLGIVFTKTFFDANIAANPGLVDPAQVLDVIKARNFRIAVVNNTRASDISADRQIPRLLASTLTAAYNNLSINTGTLNILFVNGATAQALLAEAPDELVLVNNVVDTTNSEPSDGLGIAVNAQCCQLYADIQKAVSDMNADGTLARLRAQFRVPKGFTPVTGLTPIACANTVAKQVNSNRIANYFFSKNCPCEVAVVTLPPAIPA